MSSEIGKRPVRNAVVMAICLASLFLATVSARACYPGNYPSVHFNSAEPDFGAPPRTLSIFSWQEPESRPMGCPPRANQDGPVEYPRQTRWEAIGLAALQNARRLESAGHFEDAWPHYRNALKHGAGDAAAIMDRKELFAELTPATDRALLKDYLAARRDYEFSHKGRGADRMAALADNPRAGILRPHALYVLGALQYDDKHPEQAAAIFEHLAQCYPRSPRCEAALIMIPRSLLKVPDKDEGYKTWVGKTIPGGNALARARLALRTLLRVYPHTRFRQSAVAWLARCDYLRGRRVTALETYLHQYATYTADADRESAAASVNFLGEEMTQTEAKQLRGDLRRNPEIFSDYLEYRLDHGKFLDADHSRLADLAAEVAGNPRFHLRARTAAFLAQAQYLRRRYRAAIAWSNRALSSLPGPGKDLALYVRGASYRKSNRGSAAEADFQQLLSLYPSSYLCGSARENLALLYERSGRPGLALDQYFLLGYQEDIAYLLDARMTTRQVAAYLRAHPRSPQRNLLIYTLGIRQLRDEQYARAQTTLSRLSGSTLRTLMARDNNTAWPDSKYSHPRDPRKTAGDLARLERAIARASGADARAEALYAKASYLYTNRDLLFYNAALWRWHRSFYFSFYWNNDVATRDDLAATRRHHYAHECLYRARALCLQIARQYRQTPTAPKALYRAACASNDLATFDGWWRGEAEDLHLADDAVHLMKRVYQLYPRDPLAKSAHKFAKVFADQRVDTTRNTMFKVAKK